MSYTLFLIFGFSITYYIVCLFFPTFFLQREYDENEVDPYHGQQEKQPEVEPLDLPDDLNLENDEKSDEEKEGEGIAENFWRFPAENWVEIARGESDSKLCFSVE